ncbi:MAG: glycosyltransferase family 4 protein [Burkholderiales bacterium]|nr:glycosyltransferase family 4 protein [Burkholderiales bacterium]
MKRLAAHTSNPYLMTATQTTQTAPTTRPRRVALVHDWLVVYAGAEKVLEQMLEIWPEADVFALVDFVPEKDRAFLKGKKVITTFIQKLPFARTKYRAYLPVMPLAIEQLDLSGYDLVVSSSHAVAKGVLTSPSQVHVSYVHSPIRYAWDLQHQYLRESGLTKGFKSFMARALLHYIRLWDLRTANGVDVMVANSKFVGKRIRKVYGRDAEVVYPPVDTTHFTLRPDKEEFYLTASRMVPYKMIPAIVEAFALMPDKKLVVIGDGPEMARIRAVAGSNVQILGHQPFATLKDHMQRAKAFVFAAEEDFGITPVEAQACGTPVIAYGRGGALETVRGLGVVDAQATGAFFYEQTPEAIAQAVRQFDEQARSISAIDCRANAEKFSIDNFKRNLSGLVDRALATQY